MRSTWRRNTALAAASALMLLSLPVAAMAAVSGNPFAIDGNVPDQGAVKFPDPYGSVKELGPINSNLTKLGVIHNAPKPMLGMESTNAQVDLRNVWLDSKKSTTNGDIWLYLGWERDSNTGSGFIMYEFQQAPEPAGCDYTQPDAYLIANCNPFENRQPGDFILVWDQSGSANTIGFRTWTYTDANGNGTWDKATEPLVLGPMTTLDASVAEATLSKDKFFGEAAVNLSQTIYKLFPDQCLTVGNVIPGTVTGNSDTADYKDVVLADFASHLTLSSCGSLNVTKVIDPAGSTVPGSFSYTATRADGSNLRYTADGYTGDALKKITDTRTGAGAFPGNTQVDLVAGTNYTIAETINSGPYDFVSTVCTVGGKTYQGTAFPIEVGVTTNCVITNKLQQGTLKVVKNVVNDNGGTKTVADFHASINGGAPVAFTAGATNLTGTYSVSVLPGTYQVTEPEANSGGYATTYGNCSAVVVPAGGEGVCTITNDDKPAQLTLVKQVVNDNGGTIKADQWTLSAAGPTPITGTSGSGAVTNAPVNAGSYALSESGPAGYDAGSWACVGGTQDGATIALTVGQSATCTIVNNDKPAHLTLVKEVVNDNGGTAKAEDWTLTASQAGKAVLSGATGTTAIVNAGTYDLSETGPEGYLGGAWQCEGGTLSGSQLTLGLDESASCEIVNDDQAAHLTLVKEVVNDNGGKAAATDWTLSASGPTPITGMTGAAAVTNVAVNAGSYALSESGPAGYDASAWAWVGGTQEGANVVLALGQSATCTVVNNDKPAHLTLVKKVVNDNGGTAVATDWTLSASGPTPITGATGAAAVTNAVVNAGIYDLSESGPAGYDASAWVCTGGSQSGSQITLGLDESASCEIVNDDQKASPSGSTVQSWILQDSLTIKNLRAGGEAATATFTAYSDSTCTVQVGAPETVAVNGDSAATVNGVAVSQPGTYSWQVTYSGNNYNNGFTTACGDEVTTITAKDAARP